jgi:hydrogenase expression/formation protein HypC
MPEALGPCVDPTGHCITCGDLGVEMRVLRVDESRSLALCEDANGVRATVEIGLVDASPGAELLVHAGTAIARLEVPA